MSIAFRIIKRIFGAIVICVMLFIVGFFLWRIISSQNPEQMEVLYPTDELVALYGEQGEDMYMFRQEQRSITSGEDNYGYFSVTDCVIIPEADQIQATLRYNNSTLRSTATDYSLDTVPEREAEVYEMTLVFALDLTPDNPDDNLGNDEESVRFVRVHGSVVLSCEKNLYNFRRMVFKTDSSELDLSELLSSGELLAIYADIYYNGDIDYEKTPYGTLCLYDFKSEDIPVKLDKKDIASLTE